MQAEKKTIVLCPTCNKKVIWSVEQKFRPFCNERCKLIDLGEWAAEEKRIPGETIHAESGFDTIFDEDSYLQ